MAITYYAYINKNSEESDSEKSTILKQQENRNIQNLRNKL